VNYKPRVDSQIEGNAQYRVGLQNVTNAFQQAAK